ncbi:hypothetical protein [Mucilaginibacter antarcticus]|uniref:hypothetical protein n=1 Tax=Mucilaginibacter antarcticus TaxID=1855725 RepID=UPI003624F83E
MKTLIWRKNKGGDLLEPAGSKPVMLKERSDHEQRPDYFTRWRGQFKHCRTNPNRFELEDGYDRNLL